MVDVAAVADIDRAEREQELAWAVNVEAARIIASACAASGAYFLYFSSDAVFAGTAPRYREEDPPAARELLRPDQGRGGEGGAAGRPAGRDRAPLPGPGLSGDRGQLLLRGAGGQAQGGTGGRGPGDEIRTPVDVLTLSECVLELIGLRFAGVLHIGSTDSIDRAALTRRAAALLGFPEARMVAQARHRPLAGARRPAQERDHQRGQGAGAARRRRCSARSSPSAGPSRKGHRRGNHGKTDHQVRAGDLARQHLRPGGGRGAAGGAARPAPRRAARR